MTNLYLIQYSLYKRQIQIKRQNKIRNKILIRHLLAYRMEYNMGRQKKSFFEKNSWGSVGMTPFGIADRVYYSKNERHVHNE